MEPNKWNVVYRKPSGTHEGNLLRKASRAKYTEHFVREKSWHTNNNFLYIYILEFRPPLQIVSELNDKLKYL